MLHEILYVLHVSGMAAIIGLSLYITIQKNISTEIRKKLSRYLMSASHIQLLTGFALFFLMLADINHMKIGIKMLLAIEVAVIATLYNKKVKNNEEAKMSFILIILFTSIVATVIAFLL